MENHAKAFNNYHQQSLCVQVDEYHWSPNPPVSLDQINFIL